MADGLRIGIFGTRGIPAAYGGFETFAEQLGVRLAARGHEVTVFGRSTSVDPSRHGQKHRGVRLVVLPAPRSKHLETVLHTVRTAWWARAERFDVALVCNSANFPALPLLRRGGARTLLAIDGIESARRKWGFAGRTFYLLAAWLGPRLADVVVADCRVIEAHYRERGAKSVEMIAYGAEPPKERGAEMLERLGVAPGKYVLYVSRLEPENNADVVIEAFRSAGVPGNLVVVGDAPYADEYKTRLSALAGGDGRVRFAGFVFGRGYDELRAHAACYVQATEVGGTHPALLEAMAAGLPVIANDIPEHREVLGDAGWYYRKNSSVELAARLRDVLLGDDDVRRARGLAALGRVRRLYDWDRVTTAYESLAYRVVGKSRPTAALAEDPDESGDADEDDRDDDTPNGLAAEATSGSALLRNCAPDGGAVTPLVGDGRGCRKA
ncbi:MAG: glycosyltransferase family 1 protein [Deltaproteobacteria bacterium]|nr:glycosyltransferase family 1 protein [Deltaproteobacteria bacterium]